MVKIRPARQDDCQLLWQWANDPEVRRWSFDQRPIPMDSHVEWFNRKLADPNCYFYIIETDDHQAAGQVRLDVQADGTAVIGNSVQPHAQGRGYGSFALREASRLVFNERPVRTVIAFVRPDNLGSVRMCEKAGFRKQREETVHGQVAVRMTLARDEIKVG